MSDQKPESSTKVSSRAASPPSSGGVATLGHKADIHCNQALPEYDFGTNKAYRAYSKDENKTPLIAVVSERHLAPRLRMSGFYANIDNPHLARVFAEGPVFWPPLGHEVFVFTFFDGWGTQILKPGDKEALGWRQDDLMNGIVKPMVNILQDFKDKGFVHGAINPSVFYNRNGEGAIDFVLGQSLSAPVSVMQPYLYEPIHRSMADQNAKGQGEQADDLYSLGISIAVLMRVSDPLVGKSRDEVIKYKIEYGSYAAVTGKDRFRGDILELLRGLLHDDFTQRWTLEEVMSWMDGRRLSPKQALKIKKAPRAFLIEEDRYFYAPLVAQAAVERPESIKRTIEDGSLMNWLQRSLEDEEMSERYEAALVNVRQQSTGNSQLQCMVSYISTALDPEAPMRFRGFSAIGEGIGVALMERIVKGQDPTLIVETFLNSLALNWLSFQNSFAVDVTGLFSRFEKCKRILKSSKYGEGLERALYTLNRDAPCLSPLLSDYYVTSGEELLYAFEDLCKKGKAPGSFLDKHVVSFLLEKDQKVIEPYLFDINTHENHRVIAANLQCMGVIARRASMGALPEIAKVLAPRLKVLVKRYHDRKTQEKLKEDVEKFQSSGDLVKIAAVFGDADMVKRDYTFFTNVMHEYKMLEHERVILDENLQNRNGFGVRKGKNFAVTVSVVLSALTIVATVLMFLTK